MEIEYKPGDTVPVSSALYRVVHYEATKREYLEMFYGGDRFPPCPECGKKVRYMLPSRVLRRAAVIF